VLVRQLLVRQLLPIFVQVVASGDECRGGGCGVSFCAASNHLANKFTALQHNNRLYCSADEIVYIYVN